MIFSWGQTKMSLHHALAFVAFFCCVAMVEVMCPYTKVEESFGMQAMHDFLLCNSTDCGDHLMFPAVVSRTFFGAWLTSILALLPFVLLKPFTAVFTPWLLRILTGDRVLEEAIAASLSAEPLLAGNVMLLSHACRLTLGLMVCGSLWYVSSGIEDRKKSKSQSSSGSGRWRCFSPSCLFVLLCATQFHIIFYCTRTIPNTYGLIVCNLACGCTLRGKHYKSVALLSFAAAVFRCDVLVLLVPFSLFLLARRDVTLGRGVMVGLATVAVSLCCTVGLDSFLWGSWIWPEGVVFFFNVIENKSSLWGRFPLCWYVLYALPRAFIFTYLPVLFLSSLAFFKCGATASLRLTGGGIRRRFLKLCMDVSARHRVLLVPASLFIALYSLLPHKEMRFIMIAFPWFLVPLAEVISRACDEFIFIPRLSASASAFAAAAAALGVPTAAKPGAVSVSTERNSVISGDKKADVKKFIAHTTNTCVEQMDCNGSKSKSKGSGAWCWGGVNGWRRAVFLLLVTLFILQLFTVGISVQLSISNYPGADALDRLHSVIAADFGNTSSCMNRLRLKDPSRHASVTVFIDTYASMTGINRFQKMDRLQRVGEKFTRLRHIPQALHHRLAALLALPFVAMRRILEEKDPTTGRWREYKYDAFGLQSSSLVKAEGAAHAGTLAGAPLTEELELHYTKDMTLLDEERGLYRTEGLDYLLLRYSQLQLQQRRGEFEEIFTAYQPNGMRVVRRWAENLFTPWRKRGLGVVDDAEESPFIVAMRRRCA